jgi:hypothetical protein
VIAGQVLFHGPGEDSMAANSTRFRRAA